MKRAYVDIREGQIHYRAAGSGEPMLLLHQTAFSSVEYTEVIPILAKRYRVIAMDTLGYGYSDPSPKGYRIEDYACSIVSFLDALGINRTNVVGHHTGATLATELAAVYPDRVDKLVLSGSSLYTPEERQAFISNPRYAPMVLTEDGSFLKRQWEECRTISPYVNLDIIYKRFLAHLLAGPRLHDAHHAAFNYEKKSKLPLIKSPTLVMSGDKDTFVNKLEEVKSLIPRSRIQVVEKAGNAMPLENPSGFAKAVLDFLKNPGV